MPNMLYAGLMSGTSTDGVDAVLADFSRPAQPAVHAAVSLPMPAPLRAELLALNITGPDELTRSALAANALAELYASATLKLLALARCTPSDVRAIGAHGQTVRHDPAAGYTIQINAPALLAQRTGIAVIADFRSRDVAAGGQGAPLVPAFHQALFASLRPRAVLNLGGIANLTLLDPNEEVRGFDTGPANVLLDLWVASCKGKTYDEDGAWAASALCNTELLDYLLSSEPWFELPPPKSTGRDRFNWAWLGQRLAQFDWQAAGLREQDVQATLQQLTVQTIARALKRYAPNTEDLLVCGGGALNGSLMRELAAALPYPVRATSELGVPVQQVEALAFAWLAWAHDQAYAAGLPSVTGAVSANVLGCKYPA
ncbi:anhydro-N-acetylmuramic acid kinase [Alcaligenaceae bacterium]|nr:anhydro-N-acetylmuramic acid kinase [Alcaligenaceae bacterium]